MRIGKIAGGRATIRLTKRVAAEFLLTKASARNNLSGALSS